MLIDRWRRSLPRNRSHSSVIAGMAAPRSSRWLLAVFSLCILMASSAASAMQAAHATPPAPRVGLVTMQPGEIFFERFGHDAIVVDDQAGGEPISYNFGFFNPDEPGFVGNFIRGRMRYQLAALPFADDMQYYRQVGRGVSIQWLNLTDAQARGIAAALAENARPENAHYDYEYFTDNCATRVRDTINVALEGSLKKQIEGRSRGNTYRSEAVRLASPAWWMWLGFDVGLGPPADQPLSVWDESFIPMRLADAMRETTGSNGKPLVLSEERILPQRLAAEPAEFRQPWWPWLLAGCLLGGLFLMLAHRALRAAGMCALVLWSLCSVFGLLMLYLWFGTVHRFAWGNHNVLLFNPLCLLLLPAGWQLMRGRNMHRPWFRRLLGLTALGALVAVFLLWLPVNPQPNARWIALMLPIHMALYFGLRRR